MKILGWMHQRLQNDNKGTTQTSAIGCLCTCFSMILSSEGHPQPCNSLKAVRQLKRDSVIMQPNLEIAGDVFPGFLTIGTLAIEEEMTEPPTPKFEFANNETVEGKEDVKEYDFDFITYELENFLKSEARKEGTDKPSSSQSQESDKSSTRTSQVSTFITISKKKGVHEDKYNEVEGFSLQGSLNVASTKEKSAKENISLQKVSDGDRTTRGKSNEKGEERQIFVARKYKSPMHSMKRLLQALRLPSKKLTHAEDEASKEILSTKAKFHLDLLTQNRRNFTRRIFCKKVHPESLEGTKESSRFSVKMINKITTNDNSCDAHPIARHAEDRRFQHKIVTKLATNNLKGDIDPPNKELAMADQTLTPSQFGSNSPRREQWIKTDEEFLVLELEQTERDA